MIATIIRVISGVFPGPVVLDLIVGAAPPGLCQASECRRTCQHPASHEIALSDRENNGNGKSLAAASTQCGGSDEKYAQKSDHRECCAIEQIQRQQSAHSGGEP